MSDNELLARLRREANSPVLADCCDAVGCAAAVCGPGLAPLQPGMVVTGRAMPVQWTDAADTSQQPFGDLCAALDDLKTNEVWISSGSAASATWGELLTTAARAHGAVGAIIDGYHRDSAKVLSQEFPVLSRGAWCADSLPRSAVHAYRCPVRIAGVVVYPGDLIFGDADGVVVIPQAREAEVLQRAFTKLAAENRVRDAIATGMSVTQAFNTWGVL